MRPAAGVECPEVCAGGDEREQRDLVGSGHPAEEAEHLEVEAAGQVGVEE